MLTEGNHDQCRGNTEKGAALAVPGRAEIASAEQQHQENRWDRQHDFHWPTMPQAWAMPAEKMQMKSSMPMTVRLNRPTTA
jgi:hypothetical protein